MLDPQVMPVADVFPRGDGHAQERSLLDSVPEAVQPGEVWIADRDFGTTGLHFGIDGRDGAFVICQHGTTLSIQEQGKAHPRGQPETGAVFEQSLRLGDGRTMAVRRITVVSNEPTRDGRTEALSQVGQKSVLAG